MGPQNVFWSPHGIQSSSCLHSPGQVGGATHIPCNHPHIHPTGVPDSAAFRRTASHTFMPSNLHIHISHTCSVMQLVTSHCEAIHGHMSSSYRGIPHSLPAYGTRSPLDKLVAPSTDPLLMPRASSLPADNTHVRPRSLDHHGHGSCSRICHNLLHKRQTHAALPRSNSVRSQHHNNREHSPEPRRPASTCYNEPWSQTICSLPTMVRVSIATIV